MSYIYELKIIGPARSDCGTHPNCAGCGLRALGPGESASTTVESPLEPTTNEANAWLSRAIQF
ncbi:MAG TPA: hypothetical protein PKG71_00720 [Candidatus Woesebacteria bacterium]|nr:hypothetical protein [Candidatus Woesebacteria bacterium]HNS94476.1 hypothetical protein [Candidatus Woesebacteria bacterium]